jgi:hypothetical protein
MSVIVPIVGSYHSTILAARRERGSEAQVKWVTYRHPQRAGQQVSSGSHLNILQLSFVVLHEFHHFEQRTGSRAE